MDKRCLARQFIIAAAAALLTSALLPTAHASTDMDAADFAYETQHYSEALALFERAAAAGDMRAQEVAGLMLFYGGDLYGETVPRDMARAVHWLSKAAAQGSAMAERLLVRLNQMAQR